MGINRLTNLNIRDVPGNGSIVGPSTSPSLGISTTSCESCYNTCDACVYTPLLGTQYIGCACPCCDIVCSCDCTVCDRTVPSGMWKTSEQYDAKERDAWGDDTSSTGAESCLCNINFGYIACSNCTNTGGYVICGASNVAWVVAPAATEVGRNWYCRDDAVTTAQASAACGDWFVPTIGQLQNPGYTCRTYWDSYSSSVYVSSTESSSFQAWVVQLPSGFTGGSDTKTSVFCVRAFRCVSY